MADAKPPGSYDETVRAANLDPTLKAPPSPIPAGRAEVARPPEAANAKKQKKIAEGKTFREQQDRLKPVEPLINETPPFFCIESIDQTSPPEFKKGIDEFLRTVAPGDQK